MVRSTTCDLSKPIGRPQLRIKLVALGLGAVVLPVRCIRVREGTLQLVDQRRIRTEAPEQLLAITAPVYAPVLLAGTAYTPYARDGRARLPEAVEHEVDGLEPHGHGSKDLTLLLVHLYAFLDAILAAEVFVEVDLSLGDDYKVGLDNDR